MSFENMFGIFSGSFLESELEADVEAEAVHEILAVSPSFSCSAELDDMLEVSDRFSPIVVSESRIISYRIGWRLARIIVRYCYRLHRLIEQS